MNILFIRDNPVNPDVRVEKEINSLIDAGYNVSILGWDKRKDQTEMYRTIENTKVPINLIKIKCSYGGGFKKNIIPLLRFQIREAFYLLRHRKEYDVIHACDFNTAFTASVICKLIRKPYVYDIFDYYVDAFAVPHRLKGFIERLDHNVIKRAYITILCSEQRISQVSYSPLRPYVILHNAPLLELIDDDCISLKSTSNKIKLVYVGTLAKKRRLDLIVDAIKEMSDAEFHIAGYGEMEDYFIESSEKYNNIFYYRKIDYRQTLCLESKCDVMIALYPLDNKNHVYAAPNKFYEALMLGKPIIMIKGSGMSDVVENNKFGCLVEESADDIKRGIKEAYKLSCEVEIRNSMKKKFISEYEWSIMGKRLVKIYNDLNQQ